MKYIVIAWIAALGLSSAAATLCDDATNGLTCPANTLVSSFLSLITIGSTRCVYKTIYYYVGHVNVNNSKI